MSENAHTAVFTSAKRSHMYAIFIQNFAVGLDQRSHEILSHLVYRDLPFRMTLRKDASKAWQKLDVLPHCYSFLDNNDTFFYLQAVE